jgi:hypothetical protein
MIIKIAILWVLGLLTIVPYSIYHLLYYAQREEYALLITLILFWIFGFWGVVGPILTAIKIRRVFRALETARSKETLEEILKSPDAQDVAIDLIASENHIPKFLAKKIYFAALRKLSVKQNAPTPCKTPLQ